MSASVIVELEVSGEICFFMVVFYHLSFKLVVQISQTSMDDKKLLMSLLFSNSTINGKKVEISYHKAFKMVSERVM